MPPKPCWSVFCKNPPIKTSSDYVKKGLNATQILKEVAPIVGGSGGGKPEAAQAGGKSPEHLEKLFEKVQELLK